MAQTKKNAAVGSAPEAAAEKPVKEKKPAAEKVKKSPSVKEVLKKATPKKPAEKVEEIYLQSGGTEWNVSECRDRAAEAYVAQGHRASSIKKLVIYLKPEEGRAYYVVNDDVNGCIDL